MPILDYISFVIVRSEPRVCELLAVTKYILFFFFNIIELKSVSQGRRHWLDCVNQGVKSWLKAQHSENEDHDIWSHHFMPNRWGSNGNSDRLYFGEFQNHCRW